MMRDILLVLLLGILSDNLICSRCIGVVGGEFNFGTFRSSVLYSILVTAVATVSTAVCYPVFKYLLEPAGIEYFYILLCAGVTAIVFFAIGKLVNKLLLDFSVVQKIVIFATALGICSICIGMEKYYLALVASLAYGIGLLVLMCIFFCARLSLKQTRVPKFLQGTPIDMIIVAIIALVFYGFKG